MLASQSQSRNYNPENITQNFDDILNNLAKQKQEEGNTLSLHEINNDRMKDEYETEREQQIENSSPLNGEHQSKPNLRIEIIMNRNWTDVICSGAGKGCRFEYSSSH